MKSVNNIKNTLVGAAFGFALVAGFFSLGGVSSAKGLGVDVVPGGGGGGGGGAVAVCAPVKSLTYKGDTTTGETGLASIAVNYSTAPCDKTVPTHVEVVMFESATGDVVYSNNDALPSGGFTVFGVKIRTSYQVKVSVVENLTGVNTGSQTIFAAAVPKRV